MIDMSITPLTMLSHLSQIGGLSNSIDTTKRDDKGPSLVLSLHDISENIHPSLGLQNLHQ